MLANQLIIGLFQRFCLLDEALQRRLHEHGWPDVSRAQSMVMVNIVSGIVRPSAIARNLGISRQAVHATINQLGALGIVTLEPDPADGRHKTVTLTAFGHQMRRDAQSSMEGIGRTIADALGAERFAALLETLEADWGDVTAPERGQAK